MSNIGLSYSVQQKTVLEICENIISINKELQLYTDEMHTHLSQLQRAQGYMRLPKNILGSYECVGDEYASLIMNEANKFYSLLNLTLSFDNNTIDLTSEESQNFWKKFLSTTAMTAANVVEGIGTSVENNVDGCLTLTSYITELLNWDAATEWIEDRTENHAVDEFFNNLFENNKVFQTINENSLYQYDGTMSKIFQNVGTAIGYIGMSALTGVPVAMPVYVGTLGAETRENLKEGMDLQEARKNAQIPAAVATAITIGAGALGGLVSPTIASGLSHVAVTGSTIYNDFNNATTALTENKTDTDNIEIMDNKQENEETENQDEISSARPTEEITNKPNGSVAPEDIPWNDDIFDTNINDGNYDNNYTPEYDYNDSFENDDQGYNNDYNQFPEFDNNDNDIDFDNSSDNSSDNNSDYDNNEITNNDFKDDKHYFWENDNWNNVPERTDFVEKIEEQFNHNLSNQEVSNNISGLEEIIDLTQGVNIPTSSTPIQSTINTKNNNMTPLMAGLGASVLAGLGTKAYLDNKTKKDEEDELEILEEEPLENENYKLDIEEKDYLTPTDEFAYTNEEKYEASNISELPKFN